MKAVRLRTEHLINPLGIDFKRPRMMWNCEGGIKQTAYRIVTENWDSGKVESNAMHAEYPLTLSDRGRVTWKITLWDEEDREGYLLVGCEMDHRQLLRQQKRKVSR